MIDLQSESVTVMLRRNTKYFVRQGVTASLPQSIKHDCMDATLFWKSNHAEAA
jgi:hypothetical protein